MADLLKDFANLLAVAALVVAIAMFALAIV